MSNNLEFNFGKALQQLVGHLIKNAEKVPPATLDGALAFEAFTWEPLSAAEKRTRVAAIDAETNAASPIGAHFDAYPHKFSKGRYADYLTILKHYRESLPS